MGWLKKIFGGGRTKIQHVTDPALTAQINNLNGKIAEMAKNSAQNKVLIDQISQQKQQLEAELVRQQKQHEERMNKYEERIARETQELDKIKKEMEDMKITDLGDLKNKDRARYEQILKLCKELPAAPLEGTNVGFFGTTGEGKSSLINACAGKVLCKTGLGETTLEPKPWRVEHSHLTYWDIPGQTDSISYFDATYVGVLKSMKFIGIVCNRSTHTMSKTIQLLDYLDLRYYVIVNKYDRAVDDADGDEAMLNQFRQQIKDEVRTEYKNCNAVFFVSAKHKGDYDWLDFVNAVTRP